MKRRKPELPPDLSVGAAVQRMLRGQCRAVRRLLPLAARRAHEDVEHVHQLRVATRRASAVLGAFGPWLRKPFRRELNDCLRRIRRAAARARDCDVLMEAVASPSHGRDANDQQGAVELIVRYLERRRAKAQKSIVAVARQYPTRSMRRVERQLDGSGVRRRALDKRAPTLSQLSENVLSPLLSKLQDAAQGNLTDFDALHQLRLAAKRLRYAMEAFAACYPPDFRNHHYVQVQRMQELLGAVNDGHQMALLLQRTFERADRLRRRGDPSAGRLRRALSQMALRNRNETQQRRAAFLAWFRGADATASLAALAALPTPPPSAHTITLVSGARS